MKEKKKVVSFSFDLHFPDDSSLCFKNFADLIISGFPSAFCLL